MADILRHTLANLHDETNEADPIVVKNKLEELEQEFDRLLLMAGTENEIIDRRLEQISNEIMKLKQMAKQSDKSEKRKVTTETKHRKIMDLFSDHDLELTEYSDALVYRIIERVTVLSKEKILIKFIGGCEVTEPLN